MSRLITIGLFCDRQDLAKRIRIAASLQAGNGFEVRLVDTAASTVDLALVDIDRPDSELLVGRFRQAGVTLVQIGQHGSTRFSDQMIDARDSIAVIQRGLRHALQQATRRPDRRGHGPQTPESTPLILRLGSPAYLEADTLELRLDQLRIVLRRSASSVVADSRSALEQAARLINEDGWTLNIAAKPIDMTEASSVRGSLDGFLTRAALATRTTLPAIESNRFHLRAWPDLAACGEPAVVNLSVWLVNGRWSAADLAKRSGVDMTTVNACLWAMRAAGLLDSDHALVPAKQVSGNRQASRGLLSRLARHFGLAPLRAA